MKRQDVFTLLLFGLGLLFCSYLFASSGPALPTFYVPAHMDLENRDLIRTLKNGTEVTIFEGSCQVVKRWTIPDGVPSGTMRKVLRLTDSVPPTDAQWTACFGDNFVEYVVATYWRGDTRPLKAWVNGEIGKTIGRVAFGTPCERRNLTRSTRSRHYRMTTNDDDPPKRGAAICERND